MNYDEYHKQINSILINNQESFEKLKADEDYKAKLKEGKKSGKYEIEERIDDINDAFLEIGVFLYKADKDLKTADFKNLKKFVLSETSNTDSAANLNKVIKIAGHEGIQANKDKLPKGWGTLAIISQLKDNEFKEFIKHEKINPKTPRSEVSKIVKECQGVEVIQGITLTIDSKSNFNSSRDEILSLLKTIDLKSKGWKLRENIKKVEDKTKSTDKPDELYEKNNDENNENNNS
jgi:hypothetical protein